MSQRPPPTRPASPRAASSRGAGVPPAAARPSALPLHPRIASPVAWLLPRSVAPLQRLNYRWEFVTAWCIPAALACVEPGVLGVIAERAFGAGAIVVSMLYAAPQAGNLMGVLWSRWLHGRDRVRATNVMQAGALACVAGIAFAPFDALGVAMLVALAAGARIFFSGIITARTDLWRANYPRHLRAGITSRITVIAAGVLALTSGVIGLAMPHRVAAPAPGEGRPLADHAFRLVFLGAVVLGVFGMRATSRLRWRGRAAQLRAERAHAARRSGLRAMWELLRDDRAYRGFMIAQFVLGLPNLAAMAPFQLALKPLGLGYAGSILLTQILPTVVPVLTLPLWARVLDRNHILRFRAYHSWLFVFANGLTFLGLWGDSLTTLVLARLILGAAFGGGMIAWDLGHHDFARRDRAHLYMGVHVTLTGIRGVIAPFLGTLLFERSAAFLGLTLPGAGMGAWTFLLLAACSLLAAVLFVRLHLNRREAGV